MDADLFGESQAPRSRWSALAARLTLQPAAWMRTLKARLAAGALAALFAGMALTTWQMAQVAQRQLITQANEREHVAAQQLAAVFGHRIAEYQRALRVVAQGLDAASLREPRQLSARLGAEAVLRATFSEVFVARSDGVPLAWFDSNGATGLPATLADRPYFRQALATGRPVISDPVFSRVTNNPVLVFAQPIVDAQGVQGVLGGAVQLVSHDLIESLVELHDGDDSTLIAITNDAGTLLAHPQSALLLKDMAAEPRLAEVAARWRRAGHPLLSPAGTWNSRDDIVAMAGEANSGWHLWRMTSRQVLLAPLIEARSRALAAAAVLAASLAGLLVAFMAWQLMPLARLERRAAELLHGGGQDDWPVAGGEIGALTRTLRHVWVERTQAEQFNAQVMRKLSSVMSASPVGLAFIRNERFELVSAECCHLLGRPEGELLGIPAHHVFASHDEFHELLPNLHSAHAAGNTFVAEIQMLRANGSAFWARLLARPVAADDAAEGSIWSLYDASDQIVHRRRLEHAAAHDPLTGVLNRKGFEQVLAATFDGQPGTLPAAVVMIDLDHFKPINDLAGHAAGDAVLRAVAQEMAAHVRASDTVARLGGDEFALMLPGCELERGIAIAEKVRQAVTQLRLNWEGLRLGVGASLGVAELGARHGDVAAWLAEADAACYAAKRDGRGAVRASAPDALAAEDSGASQRNDDHADALI